MIQRSGLTLKEFAISHITATEAAGPSTPTHARSLISLATCCQQLEELYFGPDLLLSIEDVAALSGPSCPRLRLLSMQGADMLNSLGQRASHEQNEQNLTNLIKSHASTLQEIDISGALFWASDLFLNMCAQLTRLQRVVVELSTNVSFASIEALHIAHPHLVPDFCRPGLARLELDRKGSSICTICVVREE